MSQTRRLGQLNAAEGWLNNYRYLVNADFKAYDFESLRTALLNYIQLNYPEDFNDFISSSEYVALVDLMSFMGQNLAFRSDLNLRETFLETAEVRGNVLSIARQLGYKSFRNGAATGFLKITSVTTTQELYDSKGTNLAGKTIVWADPLNLDFNEQFSLILNQALNKSNPIGRPVSSISTNGVSRQLYELDQPDTRTMVESFSLTARNNNSYPCEIVPVTIDTATELATENTPNPYGRQTVLFNNDGTGYGSTTNGWFFMFKQGSLKFEDFVLNTRVENRVIDLQGSNINETDVWVQSVDSDGKVLYEWTPVPNTNNKNIVFNAVSKDVRKVYEVITRENDSVSLKFGDDVFADIPTGNIRVWYRESANETLTISGNDVAGLEMSIRFVDSTFTEQDLTVTLELTTAASSTAGETLEQIKNRASRTSASQDRMITASDYNIYPEGKVSGVDKIKAVNRTHAGQSVYADLSDPTGTYRPVITFADDGFVYETEVVTEDSRDAVIGAQELLSWVENSLLNRQLAQLYYKKYSPIKPTVGTNLKWVTVSSGNATTTGYFSITSNNSPLRVGRGSPDLKFRTIGKNTLVKTANGVWTRVLDVYREGLGVSDNTGDNTGLRANGQGSLFVNSILPTIAIESWFPALRTMFTPTEQQEILREIRAGRSFGLKYANTATQQNRWKIIPADSVETAGNFVVPTDANENSGASWLVRLEYDSTTSQWTLFSRNDQTVFGSVDQLTFQNQRFGQTVDSASKRALKDTIKFLTQNGLENELTLDVADYFKLDDGRYDSSRVMLLLPGLSENLAPNDPDVISKLITGNLQLKKVQFVDTKGQYTLKPSDTTGVVMPGRKDLRVQNTHVPLRDNRVDAATTNIVDMYVLTSNYNSAYRAWVNSGADATTKPVTLTSYGLEKLMSSIIPYKSISDSIVFHPVNYKVIFGKTADIRNQVTIRITKSETTRISDAEIRSRVVGAINQYFSVDNWEFGETFYFTDMASWIHKQLGGVISSIVLVPKQKQLTSNDLFQIPCEDDEIFISSATVNDVEVVSN
jgi:guanyl-specific ribonuclease Sa